jgi:nucleoid-associated protein YgaU
MWFFTEIADGFDRMVHEDEVFLDKWGTEAAAKSLRNEGSFELAAAAITYAGFKFTTTVSKGFVDVLRLGDGVKKGGWGYGEDALRALVVVGPALRGARLVSGLVASVDANTSMGNCAWVAAARGARLSGRLFASIKDIARSAGVAFSDTGGIWPRQLAPALRSLGVDARIVLPEGKPAFSTMEEVLKAAARRRDGTLMFSINWVRNNTTVGHALLARWGVAGVRIIDRSGKVVRTLAELETSYPGISGARPVKEGLFIANSITTRALSTAPGLLNVLAVEVKPAIVTAAPPRPPPAPVGPGAVRSPPKPLATKQNMGRITVNTTCNAPNSDSLPICKSYYTYRVEPGDSLSKIARYVYKDGGRWKVIYDANRDVLGPNPHDPRALKAGMELFIPSR